jgi:hypothetical protein
MVASGSVVSAVCATVSSTAGDRSSSPAATLGSSPSQDRSVDFLRNATLVISQARLPPYTYYSKIDFTHKLDRTTVTVGAPSILAISTGPTSARASSSAWATTGSTVPVVAEGSGLLSSVGACGSAAIVACCAVSGMVSSTMGAGLRFLSVAPPAVSQLSSSP